MNDNNNVKGKKVRLVSNYILQKIKVGEDVRFYLFNTISGDIYKLNETLYEFLNQMDGIRTIDQILDIIEKIYKVDKNVIGQDFFSLIEELFKNNIIIYE